MTTTDTTTTDVVQGEPITLQFVRSFAPDFLAAWNSHDPERLIGLCDPGIRWEDPFIPEGRLEGSAQLRNWVRTTWRALPDMTFAWDGEPHLAADARSVMTAWTGTATMTGPLVPPGFAPTGRPITMTGVDTHWFRNGRLVRVRSATDVMAVARQIGAAPLAGSVAERAGVLLQRLAARRMRRRRR